MHIPSVQIKQLLQVCFYKCWRNQKKQMNNDHQDRIQLADLGHHLGRGSALGGAEEQE